MHYYVDGYNLLFRLLRANDGNLAEQRQRFIYDLANKSSLLDLEVTIVFDSHYQQEQESRHHCKNLQVIFTATGETADEYIIHRLKETTAPAGHTVVTSDKKLAWYARRRLAKTQTVEEFLDLLNKRYKNKRKVKKEKTEILLPVKPQKKPIPDPHASAETCFEYYLNTFEAQVAKEDEKERKPTKKPKQRKIAAIPKKEPSMTDEERWLKAFERSLDDMEQKGP